MSSLFLLIFSSSSESILTLSQIRLATCALCYVTEKKWTVEPVSGCDTFGNTFATHLRHIFLLHASVTRLIVGWESRKHSVTVPEIFTKSDTMKLFSSSWFSTGWEGIGVIPSKLMSLGLCGRTTMLYFYHVFKVWKQHKTITIT